MRADEIYIGQEVCITNDTWNTRGIVAGLCHIKVTGIDKPVLKAIVEFSGIFDRYHYSVIELERLVKPEEFDDQRRRIRDLLQELGRTNRFLTGR